MIKIFTLCLFVAIPFFGNAQFIPCNTTPSPSSCNILQNNTFSHSTNGINPFSSQMPNWGIETGTPSAYPVTFNCSTLPPATGLGFAYLTAFGISDVNGNSSYLEGFSQHIKPTIAGHKYMLSFYRQCLNILCSTSSNVDIHELNVVLTDCSFHTTDVPILTPANPSHHQTIYCENVVPYGEGWERVFVTFTADDSYSLFWVNERMDASIVSDSYQSGIVFSYPELIDLTKMINSIQQPTYPDCNVSLPACGPRNSTITWTSPAMIPHVTTPGSPVTVDISQSGNSGTWTLNISVDEAIYNYSSCSDFGNGTATATVNLGPCTSATPTITSAHFEFGACSPSTPSNISLTPSAQNAVCYFFECGGYIHLYSSENNSNNNWYVNDQLVSNVNGQHFSSVIPSTLTGVKIGQNKFQVQNNSNGSNALSPPTYFYASPKWNYSLNETIGTYKPNLTKTYNPGVLGIPSAINIGQNATYTWSIPGCTVTDVNSYDPEIQIYFPGTIGTSGVSGTCTTSGSNCDEVINVYFTYSPSARNPNIALEETDIDIFPNPASFEISFQSKGSALTLVEIFDLSGRMIKTIINPTSKINLSEVKEGFYWCRLTTKSGQTIKKLLIRR